MDRQLLLPSHAICVALVDDHQEALMRGGGRNGVYRVRILRP
jgi:hypothetical protein